MKSILSLVISAALVVSGYSQTRNVLVGTNNAVVQPTNFWSADATNARSGLGLGSAATNAASAFQPASSILSNLVSGGAVTFSNITIGITNVTGLQTNLDSKLSSNGSAANLTNFPTVALASNITRTAALATNVTGVVALTNGGTGATNATGARTALGVGSSDVFVGLTNLGTVAGQGFSSSPYILGSTNSTAPNNAVLALGAMGVRSVAGLTLAALTNLDNASFRSAIELGSSATNASSAFQPSSVVLSNLASSNAVNLTNLRVTNIVGWSAITNTNAATSLLGFTTNGQVVYNGTNVLTFTNDVKFGNGDLTVSGQVISGGGVSLSYEDGNFIGTLNLDTNASIFFQGASAAATRTNIGLGWAGTNAATTRTNLGLGATWLTNTNVTNFRTDIGLGWSALTNTNAGTGLVSVNTNGIVVSPTNFWTASPLGRVGYIQYSQPVASGTNLAEAARNLFVFSLTPTIFNVTNTIQLPVTTNSALYGDIAVVVHKGPTNSATIVRNGIDLITLREDNEAISLLYGTNGWDFYPNLAFHEPIYFTTTNATLYAARSRTNLALGATWLTNTNVTNFRTAIGLGTTNNVEFNELRLGGSSQMHMRGSAGNISFYNGIESENVLLIPADTDPVEINSQWNNASVRSNLGIPLAALTNTNNATFQEAVFTTNAAPTNGANFGDRVGWVGVSMVTNGVTNVFKIPIYK